MAQGIIRRVKDLQDSVKALDDLSHCLDREFRYLENWRYFAYVLGVPENIIRTCRLYLEESPTLKLFRYLQATRPQLTIEKLQNALKCISRLDIYSMLKDYGSNDKVSEVVTNSSSDMLEQIALELDLATKPMGNWRDLGKEFDVTCDILKLFEMYSNYNPTEALLRYVCVTNKEDVPIIDYLKKMTREDVLKVIRDIIQPPDIDALNAKDIFKPGSELLEKVCQLLNQDIAGVMGWRGLARRIIDDNLIDDKDIIQKLEPPSPHSIHSPTKKIVEWIAVNKQETTIDNLVEVLKKMKRNDGVKILNAAFLPEEDTIANLEDITRLDDCVTDASPMSVQKQEHLMLSVQETDPTISVANIHQEDHYDFGIQSQTIEFIGRASDRRTLREHLTQGDHQLVVLQGTAGSGKTLLLTVVAHDLIEEKYTVIYVDSRGVHYTLDHLAVKILTSCGFSDVDNPIPKVKRLFATLQRKCILMVDNVDNMYHPPSETEIAVTDGASWKCGDIKEEFKMFIKDICSFSDSQQFKVLLTTWEPIDYPSLEVKHQPLGGMVKQDCIELLTSELADFKLSKDVIEQVIRYCGGIPLLLRGAAKTIKTLESADDFCEILLSSPPERRLKMVCPKAWPEDKIFSNCLRICFRRMSRSTQRILILLSIFPNVFTKKEVLEILVQIEDLDACQLDEGLLELKEYCYVSYDTTNKSYTLLSVIQDFGHEMACDTTHTSGEFLALYKRAKQLFFYSTLKSLVECERVFFSTNCRPAIDAYRNKLDNIKQVVHWCIANNPNNAAGSEMANQTEDVVPVENACVNFFFNCAVLSRFVMRRKELKLLFCKMAQFCKVHGKTAQYFDCLVYGAGTTVRGCLCTPFVCRVALERALWCYEKAEEVLCSVGSTDMLRKEARAEFNIQYGKCMVREGRKDQGLCQIRQGLEMLEKLAKRSTTQSAKEQTILADGYNDLADAYSYRGLLTDAISLRQKRVLPTFEKILGIHPFTAKVQSLLARDHLALGQYNKALEAANKALFYQRSLFGDHQETARSFFDMGRILSEQLQQSSGRYKDNETLLRQLYDKALLYLQKALEIQQNVFDSPEETAKTHLEIAVLLTQLGETEDAETHLQAIQKCMAKTETAHTRT